MEDLKLARNKLLEENLSLVFIKNRELLFSSTEKGIKGLLYAIKTCGENLKGASMADRIVGRAAALLALYSGITALYSRIISESAIKILYTAGIIPEYDIKVPVVLNLARTSPCPLEEKSRAFGSPQEAYDKLSLSIK